MPRCARILCLVLAGFAPAGPALAQTHTIVVEEAACRHLVRHEPSGDTAFQPGVDAYGRKVAPADMNPAPVLRAPQSFRMEITFDLANRLGAPARQNYEGEAFLGTVTYDHGRLSFNGQPLPGGAEEDIATACRMRNEPQ